MTDTERISAFSTDIQMLQLAPPEALATLRQDILNEQQQNPGLSASQVGGWHAVPELAQRTEGPFRPLIASIVQTVSRELQHKAAAHGQPLPPHGWAVPAWATVLQVGAAQRRQPAQGRHVLDPSAAEVDLAKLPQRRDRTRKRGELARL